MSKQLVFMKQDIGFLCQLIQTGYRRRGTYIQFLRCICQGKQGITYNAGLRIVQGKLFIPMGFQMKTIQFVGKIGCNPQTIISLIIHNIFQIIGTKTMSCKGIKMLKRIVTRLIHIQSSTFSTYPDISSSIFSHRSHYRE